MNEEQLLNHTSPLGSLWKPHITKKGTVGNSFKSVCLPSEALIPCTLLILQWLLLLELCWKSKAARHHFSFKRCVTSHLKGSFGSKVMPSTFTSVLLSATFTRLFSVPSWKKMRAFICHSAAVREYGRKIMCKKVHKRGAWFRPSLCASSSLTLECAMDKVSTQTLQPPHSYLIAW